MKKSLILFFIFLLAFSNSVFAASGLSNSEQYLDKPDKITVEDQKTKEINSDKEYDPKEKVRVIVELEGKPTIESTNNYQDLSKDEKEKLQQDALQKQEAVKKSIANSSVPMDYKESFTTVVNGFSGSVEYRSIELIKNLSEVEDVHISHEYDRPETEEPNLLYSKELVKAQKTWEEYGYKGEGMTIGVIDTGIDPDHQDMVLSEETETEISQEDVSDLTGEGALKGKYFTEKVPFGRNYADENNTVLDLGPGASEHGMHVSGIVGANGNEAEGGLMGVAPEAQLLGLKVFGNDPEMPSTYSDIYIKAIDDAILLGADVINMSLGSTASFVEPDEPEQKAIKRAVDNGIMMAISAGNSDRFGTGFGNPYASNPDIGLVGAPGLATESLQVASFENEYLELEGFNTRVDGEAKDSVPFLNASSVSPQTLGEDYYEVADAGLGRKPGDSTENPEANDFEGVDLEGKIALISRGESAFVDKTLNAQEEGAVGVIIYNNVSGYISMASSDEINIPQLGILKATGLELKAYLDEGKNLEIAFMGEEVVAKSPAAGQISNFSSWGVTPNLNFKPEITAPGGNILSTLQDDDYGMKSGTSMAAPHVAGGSALVMQRVDKEFSLEGNNRVEMAKNILLNTSVPQEDQGNLNSNYELGLDYSPRRQGAGLMDLHAAMETPVVVTEKDSGLGKVALKEMDQQESFTLELRNVSDVNAVYNVEGSVQTDLALNGENTVESQAIFKEESIEGEGPFYNGEFPIDISSPNGANVKDGYQVVVPADSTIELNVTIDLSNTVTSLFGDSLDEIFENGNFVEGFIKLKDPNDSNPALAVPYVGFNGEWDEAPIVDDTIYDAEGEPFYSLTALITPDGNGYQLVGVDPLLGKDEALTGSEDNVGFSPDGDESFESVIPDVSFLRNAKEVEFNVLDENENELRTIRTQDGIRKNYFDGGAGPLTNTFFEAAWDGKVKGEVVEDGQYYYEIKSKVDFPDAEWQSVKIPVQVDTVDPSLEVTYDQESGQINWDAFDEDTGLSHFDVLVNGKLVSEKSLGSDADSYTVKNPDEATNVKVVAHDYAGNTTSDNAMEEADGTVPAVTALTPEALSVTNNKEVEVTGYVKDDSQVESLTINGEKAELDWDKTNQRYNFSETISFKKDGFKEIEFKAVDDSGNDISFIRRFMLDSTNPVLSIDGPQTTDQGEADLEMNVKDNFDELRLYVDGSEVYKNVFKEPYEMRSIEETINETVNLEEGKNSFEIELVDLAGNTTTKQITIYQSDKEAKSFNDIPEDYWAEEVIQKLNEGGVILGYPNGDFGTNDDISRVNAAKMIVRILDLDTDNVKDPEFNDVKKGDYGYADIAAIAESGIMVGSPDGNFNPKASLKRSEMAKILVDAYDLKGSTDDGFSDVPLDHWAYDYINTLAANKISIGYPDGTFKLDRDTTRAEFAMFLAKAEDDRFIN
ncbi:S8 family serine peptidase [Halobacillus alkaliphilus]|nr:S8 family serine peptidase [Halobacillus alkaliphilus]